jgi:hypothetical protein
MTYSPLASCSHIDEDDCLNEIEGVKSILLQILNGLHEVHRRTHVPDVKTLHSNEQLNLESCAYIGLVHLLLCCRTYGNDVLEKPELTLLDNFMYTPES